MKDFKRSLVWVRRDLRLSDHLALAEAHRRSEEVAIIFVFDTVILEKLKNKADRRVQFIHSSLHEMDESLQKQDSRLIVVHGKPVDEIPRWATTLKAQAVFTNEDYEPYAKVRDKEVGEKLSSFGCQFITSKDQVIFSGQEVLKGDGTPYQVFTPYKRSWLRCFKKEMIKEHVCQGAKYVDKIELPKEILLKQIQDYGFQRCELLIPPGENEGQKLLLAFRSKLKAYDNDRDFPAIRGTSKLSVHFRFGTVSIRQAMRMCLSEKSKGAETWLSELIWREFYFMILDRFPHVATSAFKAQYKDLKWPGKEEHFQNWCEGKTGFPIVDAAMRQLNETGFMHNRLRMIAASFLVKDLLIDWRKGEAYFAEKLLDFDLSANSGGWQWSASTGCDAQPYFRIFNPESQQKKFDPDGVFVRQWVPEVGTVKYPEPIVDHNTQRSKALTLFKGS